MLTSIKKEINKIETSGQKLNRLTFVFLKRLEKLDDYFILSRAPITKLFVSSYEEFKQFKIDNNITDKNREIIKKFGIKKRKEYRRLLNELSTNVDRLETADKSLLVMLVSEINQYLCWMIKFAFSQKRELYNVIKKQFSISDLCQFETIKGAQDALLEQKIEEVSHSKDALFDFINEVFNIKISTIPSYLNIIELIERRNLYVHNDGIVNKQYIKNANVSDEKLVEGKRLRISKMYIKSSFSHIKIFVMCSTFLIWRKLFTDNLGEIDENFEVIHYKLLKNKDLNTVHKIINFCLTNFYKEPSVDSKNRIRQNLYVNRALACKLLNSEENWKKDLHEVVWDKEDKIFQLAISVLLGDYEKASSFMLELKDDKTILVAYQEWPLFDDFRKSKSFLEKYKTIYHKNFKIYPKKSENILKLVNKIFDLKLINSSN